ncbi:MAG TPA: hypothetical protein VG245_10445 [Candidatus Dormibacteraeota bacterium]|nr:hypothetical protein [Candidatus Dormibacteraeota bacterium]
MPGAAHLSPVALLVLAAATVAVLHSILPDHWVPLAVVGRTQRWSLLRVARISGLAAAGHVLASLLLAGLVAAVGLRFQRQIDVQQGHIVGAVLVLTGLGFLAWGLTGHGHHHEHGAGQDGPGHGADEHRPHAHTARDHDDPHDHGPHDRDPHDRDPHDRDDPHARAPHTHQHDTGTAPAAEHAHQHRHEGLLHTHRHAHEEYVRERVRELEHHLRRPSLAGRLATIAVPFGVAASPDLTILPVGLAASAYGGGAVAWVLLTFVVTTMATFVGLTTVAAAVGYQVKGLWLEEHANTIAAVVLVAIGIVAFLGF